jgi:predicted HicB family RNase H-like nuclease
MMEYKGYVGKVDFDDEAAIFHGEVINTRDVITFQGESVTELQQAFRESVDDYLAFCKGRNETPDKPFSGQFVTRIPPELHRQVNVAAALAGKSLNAWVAEQLQGAVVRVASMKAVGKKLAAKAVKKKVAKVSRKPARRSRAIEQHA